MLQLAYDQYSLNVIPALGEVVTGDRGSYQVRRVRCGGLPSPRGSLTPPCGGACRLGAPPRST